MTGCAPSLAQALLPYPQYCGNLQGDNENHGTSTYHSLQAKVEKRFSGGTYFLALLHLVQDHDQRHRQHPARRRSPGARASGVISPYEQDRNRSLATDDVTHVLSAALVYDIPVGKGRKHMDRGGLANAILGGWQLSTVFRYSTGIPYFFRSSFCNVPGQFRAACIPSINGGANIFAQDLGSFDPGEGAALRQERLPVHRRLQLQLRNGSAGDELRGFGYHNQDLSLIKNTSLGGRTNLQLRIEAFNLWNWHMFNNCRANGAVTSPSPPTSRAPTSATGTGA